MSHNDVIFLELAKLQCKTPARFENGKCPNVVRQLEPFDFVTLILNGGPEANRNMHLDLSRTNYLKYVTAGNF